MSEQTPQTPEPLATGQVGPDVTQQWSGLVRLLRRRQWTVLTFLSITVLVVMVGTKLQTPIFRASATVLIDRETPNVVGVSTARDDFTLAQSNYQTYADYYRTQLEIMGSRAIAERVFANLKLNEGLRYLAAEDPVGQLLAQVVVEPVKQTRLVRIHVEDPSPHQAARIANEFAEVCAEENLAKSRVAEVMTLMKNEYLKLQTKESDLSRRYKAKHPAMLRVRQEMEQLAEMIEQEMTHQRGVRQAEGVGVANETAARSILERLNAPAVLGSLRPNNIRLQDRAQPPTHPIKPRAMINLVLGLFFGLLGGVGLAVSQELFDTSLKIPDDVERDLGLVLLGCVPKMDGFHRRKGVGKVQQRQQCVQFDPHSQAAESYRALRTSLLYATPQDNSHAVVITSPGSGEGKTTTVSNLGVALARSGLQVLLVDADMRRGRLHEAFQVKRRPGLSELLIGQGTLEAVIQPTTIPGLSVVASGTYPPNPAELLDSKSMREFLREATARFDRVLVDSPPVIAVTDPVILAAMTHTVVAVAQSGRTPRQGLHRLTTLCNDVRAKVLGVVLNNIPQHDAPAYQRYAAYRYAAPKADGRNDRRVS